jgi:opine dehydrogenase
MNSDKIAVLGGGNGAFAAAAHLSLMGFNVNLCEIAKFKDNIIEILEKKEIEIEGAIKGIARLSKVTTDIKEAIQDVEVIMVVTNAAGHKLIAELCAPHVKQGQIIFLNPGSTFGALEFARTFKEKSLKTDFCIAETATLTYGARRIGGNRVRCLLILNECLTGVFPSKKTDYVIKKLNRIYPFLVPAKNVIESSLNNLNPVIHPVGTLLNAGWIEYTGGIYLYKEGITRSVANVIEAIDKERLALCRIFGFNQVPIQRQVVIHGYSPEGNTVYEALHSDIFESGYGPQSLYDRFLTEDVPYGLVSWASLGDMLGVATPVIKSIIELTSKLHQVDYWKQNKRTVSKLGLLNFNKIELDNLLFSGYID